MGMSSLLVTPSIPLLCQCPIKTRQLIMCPVQRPAYCKVFLSIQFDVSEKNFNTEYSIQVSRRMSGHGDFLFGGGSSSRNCQGPRNVAVSRAVKLEPRFNVQHLRALRSDPHGDGSSTPTLPLILHHGTRVTLFSHFTGGEWYLTVTAFNVRRFTASPPSLSLHSLACLHFWERVLIA